MQEVLTPRRRPGSDTDRRCIPAQVSRKFAQLGHIHAASRAPSACTSCVRPTAYELLF